jgi:hypothetical protein
MLGGIRAISSFPLLLDLTSILAISACAQVDRGSIVGTVTDASSASVAAAKVTVTNLEANQAVELTTDDEGNYSAKLLRIGRYSVRVEKHGFQSSLESGVDVGINQVVSVGFAQDDWRICPNLTLNIGPRNA